MLAVRATCPTWNTAAGLTIPSLAACVRGTFRDIADRLRGLRRGKSRGDQVWSSDQIRVLTLGASRREAPAAGPDLKMGPCSNVPAWPSCRMDVQRKP